MKNQLLKIFVILLSVVTLSSLTTKNDPPAKPAKEEMAKVYVYRTGQFFGAGMNYTIFINDQKVCKLSNNKYMVYEVKPGKVMVEAKSSGKVELIKKKTFIELEAEAGGNYYIKCDIKRSITRSRLEMAEVTKNTGKRDLQNMTKDNCNTRN